MADDDSSTALALTKPTQLEVIQRLLADTPDNLYGDNCHWVLFKNGTFYTFAKTLWTNTGKKFDGDELVAQVLEMSAKAILCDQEAWECVRYLPCREYSHPTHVVLSCLGMKLGWVVIGETSVWPSTEQQEAAVGYVARTLYEMDCQENHIVATSFDWSAEKAAAKK